MVTECTRASDQDAGSALLIVLIVLVVLLSAGSAVAVVATQQHRLVQQTIDATQAHYAAASAIHIALDRLESDPTWRPSGILLDLPEATEARVFVRPYGGFIEIEAHARVRRQCRQTQAIVAAVHSRLDDALILGDIQTPLHLAGMASITGDVRTGPLGVRSGSIRSRPFRGRIDGTVHRDVTTPLPSFDAGVAEEERLFLDHLLEDPSSAVPFERGRLPPEGDVFYVQGDVVLTDTELEERTRPFTLLVTGALYLEATFHAPPGSRLVASGPIHLQGAAPRLGILYSRQHIRVSGVRHVPMQLIARDSVRVESNTYLSYPSLVYVSGRRVGAERFGTIRVADEATIDGTLLYPSAPSGVEQDRGRITVESGALVRGGIYSAADATINGTLHGTLMSERLHYFSSPQTYINWLVDASIDVSKRPHNFLLPVGMDGARLEVLRWQTLALSDTTCTRSPLSGEHLSPV